MLLKIMTTEQAMTRGLTDDDLVTLTKLNRTRRQDIRIDISGPNSYHIGLSKAWIQSLVRDLNYGHTDGNMPTDDRVWDISRFGAVHVTGPATN